MLVGPDKITPICTGTRSVRAPPTGSHGHRHHLPALLPLLPLRLPPFPHPDPLVSLAPRPLPMCPSLGLPPFRLPTRYAFSGASGSNSSTTRQCPCAYSSALVLGMAVSGGYGTWAATSTSSAGKLRRRGLEVVCEATTGRRPDSVKKRERQNDKHRIRNHARKAEMRTRMKKVPV